MTTDNDEIFNLKREARLEPFRATIPSGDDQVTLTFSHLANIDQFRLAELSVDDRVGDLAFMTGIFELALIPEELALLVDAKLTRGEMATLYRSYERYCATTRGESPASST